LVPFIQLLGWVLVVFSMGLFEFVSSLFEDMGIVFQMCSLFHTIVPSLVLQQGA
jgi:hypothetical protein